TSKTQDRDGESRPRGPPARSAACGQHGLASRGALSSLWSATTSFSKDQRTPRSQSVDHEPPRRSRRAESEILPDAPCRRLGGLGLRPGRRRPPHLVVAHDGGGGCRPLGLLVLSDALSNAHGYEPPHVLGDASEARASTAITPAGPAISGFTSSSVRSSRS